MEENSDDKRKTAPSVPITSASFSSRSVGTTIKSGSNRKMKKKKKKKRRRKQQRIEEDLKKAEVTGKYEDLDEGLERNRFEENPLDRSNRKYWGRNSRKKESIDGGEARFAEKDESEVTAAIGSERSEAAAPRVEGLPEKRRGIRKRYDSKKKKKKKKKNQDAVECRSIAPRETTVTDNKTPVKDAIRVYRNEVEKATGKKSFGSREKAVTDDETAIETKFENLSIKEGETKNLKAQTISSNRNRLSQRHHLPPQRVKMPIRTATMVWVKKGQNERACDDEFEVA